MNKQIPLDETTIATPNDPNNLVREIIDDVAYRKLSIVNVVYFGRAGARKGEWVLIDTGLPGSARSIRAGAEERFGEDTKPAAIILTHGHFDHVGGVKDLAEYGQVPIFAHSEEFPFLTDNESYPPPMAE